MNALSDSIRQTVQGFRSECSEWESEVRELFDDVDRFLADDRRANGEALNSGVAEDVAGLRGLVEQQTEVLTALVNALTGQSVAQESANENSQPSSPSSAPEVDPFERLQQAVNAATESS